MNIMDNQQEYKEALKKAHAEFPRKKIYPMKEEQYHVHNFSFCIYCNNEHDIVRCILCGKEIVTHCTFDDDFN